jgi:hypothetical protein
MRGVKVWGTARNRRTLYKEGGSWAEKRPGPLRFARGPPRGAVIHALWDGAAQKPQGFATATRIRCGTLTARAGVEGFDA